MEQQQFGYTPVSSGITTTPLVTQAQAISQPGMYFNNKSKVASDIESIMNAALQVGKSIKDIDAINKEEQKQADKNVYLQASGEYRDMRASYIEGLNSVKNNSEAYKQHVDNFREQTKAVSSKLSPDYQETFNAASENFLMYQGFNVEEQQQREQKVKYKEELTATADLVHSLPIAQAKTVIQDIVSQSSNYGVDKKDAEEFFVDAKVNAMLVRLNSNTEINYGTVSSMNKEVEDVISIMPNVKNSKTHAEVLGKIKTIKNGLDSELESKVGYAITVGDYNMFNKLNKEAYSVGAIDKDKYSMNAQRWVKSNYDADAVADKLAKQVFTTTSGNVSIPDLENKVDSKISNKLKVLVTDDIKQAVETGNISKINYHQANNVDIFNKTINAKATRDMLNYVAILDNPKATDEDKGNASARVAYNKNLADRYPLAINTETAKRIAVTESIISNPQIGNKGEALSKAFSPDFKEITVGDKFFLELKKEIPQSTWEAARKDVSIYKAHVGMSDEDITKIIKTTYTGKDLKGTNATLTKTVSDVIPFTDKTEAVFVPSILKLLNEDKATDKVSKITELVNREGTIIEYDKKGNLVFRNGLQNESLIMDNNKIKILQQEMLNQVGEDKPGIASLVADHTIRKTLIEGVGEDLLIGPGGKAFFGMVDKATTAIGNTAGQIKEDTTAYWENAIKNYEKWDKQMVKDFNEYLNKKK